MPSQRRGPLATLVMMVLLVAAVFWVAHAIVAHNQLQNCVDSGRRTCLDAGPPPN